MIKLLNLLWNTEHLLRQLEELREYNAQLEKLIKAQREEMVKIRQEIEDVTTIDRTIIPHMFKMIDGSRSLC